MLSQAAFPAWLQPRKQVSPFSHSVVQVANLGTPDSSLQLASNIPDSQSASPMAFPSKSLEKLSASFSPYHFYNPSLSF